MPDLNLNIVSLDVPYPANYGGSIDIFYKLKALHKLNLNIHLHCFEYGRAQQDELNKYCTQVYYYKRKTGLLSNLSLYPYIINSRRNKDLLTNLQANNYPILFEGLHSCYYLLQGYFKNRQIVLRSHNIEHHYYMRLAQQETNLIKKLFFYKEAVLLSKVLKQLPKHINIAAISKADNAYLQPQFKNTFWLPPFHSNNTVTSSLGNGDYALYHANLSVAENNRAAEYIIKALKNTTTKIIIAGKQPTKRLQKLIKTTKNIQLISNPGADIMEKLIANAHSIILLTFQNTGIKLKLLESLYKGRFCIANDTMVNGTDVEGLCIPDNNNLCETLNTVMSLEFTKDHITKRQQQLDNNYNNLNNAKTLFNILYN